MSPPQVQERTVVPPATSPTTKQDLTRYAAAIAALSLGAAVIAALLSLLSRGPISFPFTPEHVAMLGMVDNAPARLGFRVALLVLTCLGLWGVARAPHARPRATPLVRGLGVLGSACIRAVPLLAVASVLAVAAYRLRAMGFPGGQGRRLVLACVLAGAVMSAIALRFARIWSSGPARLAILAFLAAYALALSVPGLRRPVYLSGPLLEFTEWHYSVTVAQGDRLAAGLRLGEQVNLNYGLIPPLALASLERAGGFLDFASHVRLVQWSQVAFLLLALAAFVVWQPRAPLAWLLSALLVGTWVATSHDAVYHPNQAGWRSLGYPLGVLALLLARRTAPRGAALLLGAAAAFLVLYNPETGICLTFGFALFLLSRSRPTSLPAVAARSVEYASLAALAVVALVFTAFRMGLGYWPPLRPAVYLGFITRFGSGYASLPLRFDPLALLIFIHAAFLVALLMFRWRVRPLSPREGVLLAVSGTTLVWFAYYVNRPDAWNLWTFLFLYAFLAADLLRPRSLLGLRRLGPRAALDPRVLALGLVALPAALATNFQFLVTPRPSPAAGEETAVFSGVVMPKWTADLLNERVQVLRASGPSTLYFSRHSYSIPLETGTFLPLPMQDVFAETITREDFTRLLLSIERSNARTILIEDVQSAPPMQYVGAFYRRLAGSLPAEFRRRSESRAWEVWQR